jgi:hypothetical protein
MNATSSGKFQPTKIELKKPVPADIEIAQSAQLKPIALIAEEMGLLPEEVEQFTVLTRQRSSWMCSNA